MEYLGEHLIYGQLGHFFIILSFVSSITGALFYFLSLKNQDGAERSKLFARICYYIQASSTVFVFGILFFLIFSHYYEYYYVWHHSNSIMPARYIFACIWEGQEGSFLLWMFWNAALGYFIMRKKDAWEAPVMAVMFSVQAFLSSMLLGVYVLGHKIGSDPFILLRQDPEMANLPFVQMNDYLSKIKDGRGLNPLLQNYWMIIHPPVLFLGFALTTIPFAFAIAGLWTGKMKEWIKPAISWTFVGIMILGTGILMGAAWAYESLSFGGFWAWDPVENASLVPWLILVAAGHVMLIFQKRKTGLLSTILLSCSSFLLVLYSTFLTRSGILGNSSVHSFTDLGMSGQLLLYMGFYVILTSVLMIVRRGSLFSKEEEEKFLSREFWMFIGVLVILISGFQITIETSKPVINKIFHTNLAPPANVKDHYNRWQLPMAVIICLLMGIAQYFKYRNSERKEVIRSISYPLIFSLIASGLSAWYLGFTNIYFIVLLFSGLFAFTGNLDYLIRIGKGKIGVNGASVAHAGFGLLILGVLISTSKSQIISQNHSNVDLGKELPGNENIMLVKGDTLAMGGYYLSYRGKEKEGVNIHYLIDYFSQQEDGKLKKLFTLKPLIQTNPRMGNVAEPDTRHYLHQDVYTHITYADIEENEAEGDYKPAKTVHVAKGDTFSTNTTLVTLKDLNKNPDPAIFGDHQPELSVAAVLEIIDINKHTYRANPVFAISGNTILSYPDTLKDLGIIFEFKKVDPSTGKMDISFQEKKNNSREFIVMKAIVFPYINLLWMGAIIMVTGTWISVRNRKKRLS